MKEDLNAKVIIILINFSKVSVELVYIMKSTMMIQPFEEKILVIDHVHNHKHI